MKKIKKYTVNLAIVSQQIFVLMKTSSRRLDQALLIRLQKTSSRRLDQDQYTCLGHTSSRRIQDVFKTS